MIPEAALDKLRRENPVPKIAGKWVSLRRGSKGSTLVGPCPICSTGDPASKTAARFECTDDGWVCAVCCAAGDVIRLVEIKEGVDFRTAVQRLGGADDEADPEKERQLREERARKKAEQEAKSARFREEERVRLYRYWQAARRIAGSPVEDYLALRTHMAMPAIRLRYHPAFNYNPVQPHPPRDVEVGRKYMMIINWLADLSNLSDLFSRTRMIARARALAIAGL